MCTGNFFGNKTLATPPLLCDRASHAYPQFPKSTKKLHLFSRLLQLGSVS